MVNKTHKCTRQVLTKPWTFEPETAWRNSCGCRKLQARSGRCAPACCRHHHAFPQSTINPPSPHATMPLLQQANLCTTPSHAAVKLPLEHMPSAAAACKYAFSCTSRRRRRLLPRPQRRLLLVLPPRRLLLGRRALRRPHRPRGTCRYTKQQRMYMNEAYVRQI